MRRFKNGGQLISYQGIGPDKDPFLSVRNQNIQMIPPFQRCKY